jgi:hypothetical protein
VAGSECPQSLDNAINVWSATIIYPLAKLTESGIQVLSDAEFHKSVQEGGKYFRLDTNGFAFSVDVVTKIDRS